MLINSQMYFHSQEVSPSYYRCNYSILLAVPLVPAGLQLATPQLTCKHYTNQVTGPQYDVKDRNP